MILNKIKTKKNRTLKFSLLVFIFLILSTCSYALTSATQIMYSGESYNFEGYNIYPIISSGGTEIMVKIDANPVFLDTGMTATEFTQYRAEANTKIMPGEVESLGDLTVELEEVCFNVGEDSCGRINHENNLVEPALKFKLSLAKPDVTLTKTISKTTVWPGEEVTVTIKIENNGDVSIKDLKYEETYPQSIRLSAGSSINIDAPTNTISKSIALLPSGETLSLKYNLKVLEPVEYSLRGEYSYYYKDKLYEEFSSSETITLKDIVTTSLFSNFAALDINDTTTVTLSIQNNVDEEVDYNSLIEIPQGLEIIDREDFLKKDNKTLTDSGELDKEETITKSFEVKLVEEGDFTLNSFVNTNYIIDNPIKGNYITISSQEIETSCVEIAIKPSNTQLLSEEESSIEIFLKKSSMCNVEDIKLNISTALVENQSAFVTNYFKEISFDKFLEDEEYLNYEIKIRAPSLNETNSLTFGITGEYKVVEENKEVKTHTLSGSSEIKAYTLEDAITISQELEPQTIKPGETAIMKVFAKNNLDGRSFNNIFSEDIVPEQFIFKEIITKSQFKIEPLEKIQIYSYMLEAPNYINKTVSNITTKIKYQEFDASHSIDLATSIDLEIPSLSAEITAEGTPIVGGLVRLGYLLKNTGAKTINNVCFDTPLFVESDLVGEDLNNCIIKLDPEEEVKVLKDYRLKKESTSVSNEKKITFEDEYGNEFEGELGEIDVIIEAGSLDCFILATKELVLENYLEDEENNILTFKTNKTPVSIVFENLCEFENKVQLIDSNLDQEIIIKPYEKKSFQYIESIKHNSSKIKSSKFKYTIGKETFFSRSNSVDSKIIINESAPIEVEFLNEESTNNDTQNSSQIDGLTSETQSSSSNQDQESTSKGEFSNTQTQTIDGFDIGTIDTNPRKILGIAGVVAAIFGIIVIIPIVIKVSHIISKKKLMQKIEENSFEDFKKKNNIDEKKNNKTAKKEDSVLASINKTLNKESDFVLDAPHKSEEIDELRMYIKVAKRYKIPHIKIEKNLVNSGWDKKEIDKYL